MPLSHAIAETQPSGGLTDRVSERLDARLQSHVDHPIAVALSGGGDSMVLLDIAADWARRRGRRLLALTVDHRLNPDSKTWVDFARDAAFSAGADWRGLDWLGAKPVTGLPAAARAARHALIADAARAAGARVMLFAHTADDVEEGDWMREQGSTLGALRPWSPSPVWPQGRGLMLMRPLLGERRAALRAHLRSRGLDWIDDPANDDHRFARPRARAALAEISGHPSTALSSEHLARGSECHECAASPEGLITAPRTLDASALAAAMVCAGGGDVLPRGDRLARLITRLDADEDFTAVLSGARLTASGPTVAIMREAGEYARRSVGPLNLTPGEPADWDGRFEIEVEVPGWSVLPAAGRMAQLSKPDRAWLANFPAALRATLPVLFRDDRAAPVLAWRAARVRCLVGERLDLALDQTTHENDLRPEDHGAKPSNPLFLTTQP